MYADRNFDGGQIDEKSDGFCRETKTAVRRDHVRVRAARRRGYFSGFRRTNGTTTTPRNFFRKNVFLTRRIFPVNNNEKLNFAIT